MSVNKIILVGNVGKDPVVRYVEGTAIASFSLATSDRASTDAAAERTEWHNIVLWGKMAERAERYVRRGAKLYVEGKMRYRVWEDRNAISRTVAEVYVDYFEILSRPNPDAPAAPAAPAAPKQ